MDVISFSEAATANSRIESFIENPDSTSGIVTVPKVIASGETITIPAGRVAVLPNVQVDGVMNIEGEVFVPSGATTEDLDTRIALKADTTYVNTQLSLKANTADLKEIGVNQTWQDVKASRVSGTTYTNTTGKPINVIVTVEAAVYNTYYGAILTINGNLYARSAGNEGITYAAGTISVIIPNGATYKLDISNGLIYNWLELR